MSSSKKNRKSQVANGTNRPKTTTGNQQQQRRRNETTHNGRSDDEDDDDHDDDDDSVLAPPTFSLPSDLSGDTTSSRYELWTIRIPSSVDLLDLQDCRLTVPLSTTTTTTTTMTSAARIGNLPSSNDNSTSTDRFEANGSKYTFTWGHAVENESFRVLVPSKQKASALEDEDDDDDNDSTTEATSRDKSLVPCNIPFARHLNIVQTMSSSEQDWAPRCGPAPAADTTVRRAYGPILQKSGLKRRWVPLGGGVTESFVAAAAAAAAALACRDTKPAAAAAVVAVAPRDKARTITQEALPSTRHSSTSARSKTNSDTFEASKPSKRLKREPDQNESSHHAPKALVPKNEPTFNATPQRSSLLGDNESSLEQRQAQKAAKREKKAAKKAKKERKSDQKVKKEQDD
jgi:DNA-directed RNA polymerase I subunit RPA34.5